MVSTWRSSSPWRSGSCSREIAGVGDGAGKEALISTGWLWSAATVVPSLTTSPGSCLLPSPNSLLPTLPSANAVLEKRVLRKISQENAGVRGRGAPDCGSRIQAFISYFKA
jgi:hypothetical protein